MNGYHWIASYPKSGNTWLRLALCSLRQGGAPVDFTQGGGFCPVASSRAAFDDQLGVDSCLLTEEEIMDLRPLFYEQEAASATGPLLRKVHDAQALTPSGEWLFPARLTLGAIYIVRDPRDVAVSLADHMGLDLDAAIDVMARPEAVLSRGTGTGTMQLPQRLLTWSAHVSSWLDAPQLSPLLLRYEDMLRDLPGELARVARHLGWDATPETIRGAAAQTRFEVLRAEEERSGFPEGVATADRFFRRGIAGGWRDTLSPTQAGRLERQHGDTMARLGYLRDV